jgi:hypothetical protein
MRKYSALILGGLCLFNSCGGGSSAPPQPLTLQLAPASLNFGVAVVGTTSSSQVETLTNTGSSELPINGVAITGANARDFDLSSACGSSLGAGANCTLSVTFTPSQLGQRNASITIADDGVGSPQVLSLNGLGGETGPNATLSATSLAFGSQTVDKTSPPQTIMLSNYGTTALTITGITTGTNFGQTNTCNSPLVSGANCTVSVTFTPGNTGNLSGTLSFADSAADSPQMVSLSGAGVSDLGGECIYVCGSTRCGELTGYCVGLSGGACRQAYDPVHCPTGQPAKKMGTGTCGDHLDTESSCTP